MIKKTLYFGSPAYLSTKLEQLVIRKPDSDDTHTVPIEDIGVILLDNLQITLTQALLEKLLDNNCAVITCDSHHLPVGLLLPLCGNTIQNERFRRQIEASLPLKKQLWQQTISCKIYNQSAVLDYATSDHHENMQIWANTVRSGDPDNLEGRAAAYYWRNLFPGSIDFTRDRDGDMPNSLLNYGYAIVRAIVARALVSAGLLPTLGIHHHNRYNAYCLADDIMEPYRPYVDKFVLDMLPSISSEELNPTIKTHLLEIPVIDVIIGEKHSPLMIAVSTTVASLVKCFSGEMRHIIYPQLR